MEYGAGEDRQNRKLLDLSGQILQLTKEVRAYGDTVQSESAQNRQLLDLSKQNLKLTKDLHDRTAADGGADRARIERRVNHRREVLQTPARSDRRATPAAETAPPLPIERSHAAGVTA
jgi:hypothetical protein